MPVGKPSPPARHEPEDWEHYKLWLQVREAILALPAYFKTATSIEGMLATDIFTLNAALGATIEEQVVQTLNSMRSMWDPEKKYQGYSFIRQAQTFPDVLLRKKTNGQDILLGIELKGWYILAKEGMPNFRFTVTETACTAMDLIVVVPWVLSNVLAGSPVAFNPYIELALHAAEKRNYHWQVERATKDDRGITVATGVAPYPIKSDKISDRPAYDAGGNFGRLARNGMLDPYITEMMRVKICGVAAMDWLDFFRKHAKDAGE